MREFVIFTISGLTTGSIYAITASGLTLTYTTTGVFNFAHGAIGMVAAFLYWQLHYGWGVPVVLSYLFVLALFATVVGLGLEKVVMRRLEGTSDVTKLVATIALLLGLVSFTLWVWDPNQFRSVDPLWQGSVVEWGAVRISYNDLAVLAVAALVAVGLRLLLYRTRIGVAMRGSVDDRNLAMLNGSSSVANSRVAWSIGASLAALGGMLVASKLSLSPLPLTLLIVNAYAAAVIGRLRSLPMTFVGAIGLGLLNDYGVSYLAKLDTGRQYLRGLVAVIPVAVLFFALLTLPTAKLRGVRLLRSREFSITPTARGGGVFAVCVVLAGIVLSTVLSPADLFSSTKVWGLAIIALSLVPLLGYSGWISLCQLTFAGVGAIVVAHLGGTGNPLVLLLAAVIAGAVGTIVALPALRLSGIYLALATAAFAVAMDRWVFTLPEFTVFGRSLDISQAGSLSFTRTRIGPLDLASDQSFFIAGSAAFALCALAVVAWRRSERGHLLVAMKDSPAACATIGLNLRTTTLGVFASSAAMAGFGGAVYGMALQSAAPNRFDFFAGTAILLAVVIGGVSSIGSAVLAGVVVGAPVLANLFPSWTQLTGMLVALGAIRMGTHPNGIILEFLRPRWDPVRRTPKVLVGASVVAALVWGLRLGGVIDSWTWVVATSALLFAVPTISQRVQHVPSELDDTADLDGFSAPLVRLGLDAPVSSRDVVELDGRLGLAKVRNGIA